MATPYKIHLDAYDGPLDLLLDLIRKQELDIHNIPIAKITGQYLEYLHKLEDLDIDVSADLHLHGRDADSDQVERCCCRPTRWRPRRSS